MPVILSIRNIEEELINTEGAIVINSLSNDSDVDRTYIEAISSTRLNKDEKLCSVPKCGCGKTKLGIRLGEICDYCGTEVTMSASSVKHELWMQAPETVTGLILPKFLIMLKRELQLKKNFNGVEYLLNPAHKPPRGQEKNIRTFRERFYDMPRGVNSFIENIDEIIRRIEGLKNKDLSSLKEYVHKYRSLLFPKFLPLPSRLTLLIEDTHVYTYYDKAIDKVLDSIYTVAGISKERDQKTLESRIASALISLAQYYEHTVDNNIGGKPGIMRKMLLGSRLSYGLRTIVTSLHGPHDYRCPKIPKSLAAIILRPMIVKRMIEDGYTLVEAYDYVKAHEMHPTDYIVKIMYDLVEATKPVMKELTGRDDMWGIVFNLTRYPGLRIASSQTFLVREFSDDSIELSVLCLKGPNCDFDGELV